MSKPLSPVKLILSYPVVTFTRNYNRKRLPEESIVYRKVWLGECDFTNA